MQGLDNLRQLPDDIKNQIIAKYDSIENFYKLVFDLNVRDYKVFIEKKEGFETTRRQIENQVNDIEDWLETLGLDGRDITSDISSDHGEIIVSKHVAKLDNYLQQYNTDFSTLRKWMKDKFGI